MKHIVCYSGGHSSGLAGVEVARRFGPENTIWLNHDIHFTVEHADIKRFKRELSEHIGIPITYANYKHRDWDQFDLCVHHSAFKIENGSEICTSRLKTEPFMAYLQKHHPDRDCIIYYGFDDTKRELDRMQRRIGIMAAQGYRTDYPLALWKDRTIHSTKEVGIEPPSTYEVFQHANCIGCLKAGWQHWYIVYCTREDIWLKAKWAEDEIGYAIHHDESGPVYLEDMESRFALMKAAGIEPTERTSHQKFWASARKVVPIAFVPEVKPCEMCTG